MIQYENVFVLDSLDGKKKTKKVIARLFDTDTKKSSFTDVTHLSIPDIFIADGKAKNSKYKSYLDNNISLTKKSFTTISEYNTFIKSIKTKTGNTISIEHDGEWIEIDETIFEDDAFGYQNLAHTYIQRAFPNPMDSNHTHRVMFIDIETRSGDLLYYSDELEVEVELVE